MLKEALIVFVRNPVKGQVKTRIAKDKGSEFALKTYTKLLAHTQAITSTLPLDVFVFYADFINDNDIWNWQPYFKQLQNGNDLGERMMHAFAQVFKRGYKNLVIIGSDCYELSRHMILQAFEQLQNSDAVIGPSKDGGFYLIGLKKLIPILFKSKIWSTNTVASEAIAEIKKQKLTLFKLPVLSDVDTAQDCEQYPELYKH